MFNINFSDDWIRTSDLWNWKWPLYQLSHNHCPKKITCLWPRKPFCWYLQKGLFVSFLEEQLSSMFTQPAWLPSCLFTCVLKGYWRYPILLLKHNNCSRQDLGVLKKDLFNLVLFPFFINPHSNHSGFFLGHQCSWNLDSVNSMQNPNKNRK